MCKEVKKILRKEKIQRKECGLCVKLRIRSTFFKTIND